MPDINGSNGVDNINITDDSGVLNGTPQGAPINNVRARRGDDDIDVSNSTILGFIRANAGNDIVSIEGSNVGNVRLGNGDDELNFISTTVTGDLRGGSGTDSLNLPVGTIINDVVNGTITVTAGGSYSLSQGSFTLPSSIVVNYSQFENGLGFLCFSQFTKISMRFGETLINRLTVGDLVLTSSGDLRPIRWIGSRKFDAIDLAVNPKLRPVRIRAGALGKNMPEEDLWVSRQHRVLVRSAIAQRMFGTDEVLIPAIKLTELEGIEVDEEMQEVEYYHLLFDEHEVICSNGAWTESLFTGSEALKAVSPEARKEIETIFPVICAPDFEPTPARHIPQKGKLMKELIARHKKNQKPIYNT